MGREVGVAKVGVLGKWAGKRRKISLGHLAVQAEKGNWGRNDVATIYRFRCSGAPQDCTSRWV